MTNVKQNMANKYYASIVFAVLKFNPKLILILYKTCYICNTTSPCRKAIADFFEF